MPVSNTYISRGRLIDCDICGFTYRVYEMRKGVSGKQKGLNVCPTDFDPVHPGDVPFKMRKAPPRTEVR